VQDAQSGILISTNVLAFAGDGHNTPGVSAAYGVTYSTNAGQTWIDASTVTTMNGGNVIVAGATNLRGMAVYNGKLYVTDGRTARSIRAWTQHLERRQQRSGRRRQRHTAADVYNGRLYAADGAGKSGGAPTRRSWTQSNNNTAVSTTTLLSLAVFNGRLFAGDQGGRVFVSTDATNGARPRWRRPNFGQGPTQQVGGSIWSLAAFNGRFFAGDSLGRVFITVDGSTWNYSNGLTARRRQRRHGDGFLRRQARRRGFDDGQGVREHERRYWNTGVR